MDDTISRQAAIKELREMAIALYGYDSASVISCAIYKLQNMPSAQQWIPVSERERLPKYGIDVLTVDKDGYYEFNHIVDEEDATWYWKNPIAWTPLPEPYTERLEE